MALIIAEIGTSHEGSLEKAKQLIDSAVLSGANCIKFQWVYASEILHPKTGIVKLPTGDIPLYDRFKQLECPKSFYKKLLDYVHSKGCKFCCSPFGLKSLKELLEIKPDYVKIASPELNHYQMLNALKEYRDLQREKIPVIISSGVSTLTDIEKAINILGKENLYLLHCITSYPSPEEEYNIKLVQNLSNIFGIATGISDHSLHPFLVPSLTVAFGGTVIEKHFTLSKNTLGLDDPVALEPEEFATMVHVVNQSEACIRHYGQFEGNKHIISQLIEQFGNEKITKIIGDGVKKLADSESQNYGRTNRSLHYLKDLKKGDVITKDDIAILRTEKILSVGISPQYYDLLIGKKIQKNVISGDGVLLEDFII